jgi:hypothetical protein
MKHGDISLRNTIVHENSEGVLSLVIVDFAFATPTIKGKRDGACQAGAYGF